MLKQGKARHMREQDAEIESNCSVVLRLTVLRDHKTGSITFVKNSTCTGADALEEFQLAACIQFVHSLTTQ